MLVDNFILAVPFLAFIVLHLSKKAGLILQIPVCFIYSIYFVGEQGNTPGQKMVGLKVATADRKPPGYGKAFLRAFVYLIHYVPLLGGVLSIVSAVMISVTKKSRRYTI